jgi:hypothetical protein
MGKRFEKYKANHDLGPAFVAKADGVGGLIIPEKAMKRLRIGSVLVDGIAYPFVVYEDQKYPIVKTPQGWTIGGKVAEKQHAKNVARRVARRAA